MLDQSQSQIEMAQILQNPDIVVWNMQQYNVVLDGGKCSTLCTRF